LIFKPAFKMIGATQLGLAALVWIGLANQVLALGIDQAIDDLDLVARDLFGSLEKTMAQMALAAKGKRDSEELDERSLEGRLYLPDYHKYAPKKGRSLEGRLYLPDYYKYAPKKGRSLKGRLYLPDYHKYAPKKG
jgi:predicted small lipoprotein YifL